MEQELLCYNRGCGQKYKEPENTSESCRFHPGHPVFHDAYKGWSCCNKKTTDFTEFLNIPGCKRDRHSNEKPPPPPTPAKAEEVDIPKEVPKPTPPPMVRPSGDTTLVTLKYSVAPSLKALLDKQGSNEISRTTRSNGTEGDAIAIGTSCKNAGCKKSYEGPSSNSDTCVYHDGIPVFHEGLKFWTCCNRKTTDFDAFLDQAGCLSGNHVWIKPKAAQDAVDKSKACRYDWHQTAEYVVVSIYSKAAIPSLSRVDANAVKLHAIITFGQEDRKEFELETTLYGIVDIEKSSVNYLSTKVEVSLKKAEAVAWKMLSLPSKVAPSN